MGIMATNQGKCMTYIKNRIILVLPSVLRSPGAGEEVRVQ